MDNNKHLLHTNQRSRFSDIRAASVIDSGNPSSPEPADSITAELVLLLVFAAQEAVMDIPLQKHMQISDLSSFVAMLMLRWFLQKPILRLIPQ